MRIASGPGRAGPGAESNSDRYRHLPVLALLRALKQAMEPLAGEYLEAEGRRISLPDVVDDVEVEVRIRERGVVLPSLNRDEPATLILADRLDLDGARRAGDVGRECCLVPTVGRHAPGHALEVHDVLDRGIFDGPIAHQRLDVIERALQPWRPVVASQPSKPPELRFEGIDARTARHCCRVPMTVVAIMSSRDGEPHLDAVVRPGGVGVEIDGSSDAHDLLLGLNVLAGDPPEPLAITDGDDWIQALPWALRGTYTWAEFISHGRHGEPLNVDDLAHHLELYQLDLRRNKLQDTAINTYLTQARMFLKWAKRMERSRPATVPEHLEAYSADVRSRGLAPLTVHSYIQYAGMFCRWLDGGYRPGQHSPSIRDGETEDDSWLSEQQTQARLVEWLRGEGWEITGEAVGHQHGVDVTAVRDKLTMDIEVKGHPQNMLIAGENKGQARSFHPAAQARTYFANALHAALTTAHKYPTHLVAIALPAVDRFRNMATNTRGPLEHIGVGVYLVAKEGEVEALIEPHLMERSRG